MRLSRRDASVSARFPHFWVLWWTGRRGFVFPPSRERKILFSAVCPRSIQGLGTARKTEAKGTNGKRKRALHGAKRAFFSPICMGHLMHAQITLCKHVRTCDFISNRVQVFSLTSWRERVQRAEPAYVPYRSTLIPHSARSDSELGCRRRETMDHGLLVCGSRYCVTSEMPYSPAPGAAEPSHLCR
jgi:hypothetical protein